MPASAPPRLRGCAEPHHTLNCHGGATTQDALLRHQVQHLPVPWHLLRTLGAFAPCTATDFTQIWAVPVHATKRLGDVLNAALSTGRVVLIASVNGSKAWQGFAEMTSAVSAEPQPLTFAGDGDATGADNSTTRMREGFPFKVKWLCRCVHTALRIAYLSAH